MVGIELLGAPRQREAALPVARVGQQLTEKSDGVAVHGVEGDGPLRRIPEALEFLLKEERLGEAEIGQVIGRSRLDGTPRGGRPGQGIRLNLNPCAYSWTHRNASIAQASA